MRIYIAGPMRGIEEFNFPEFLRTETYLRMRYGDKVEAVFCPATRDIEAGFRYEGLTGNENLSDLGFDLREALGADVKWICEHATHIYMLKGWASSKGATAERALGLALGLKVLGAAA